MKPTSEALARWILHVWGQDQLPQVLKPLEEAIELNREGRQIILTFGQRHFEALVGFIDMRGFSELARDLPPEGVRDLAAPFVAAVVEAARRNRCCIDKTIGDEVMIVLPSFGEDVELANIGLAVPDPWVSTLSVLVADLLRRMDERAPGRTFSAGFALGPVVLDAVGADGYEEWTVYGNVVNAAKRLQEVAAQAIPDRRRNSIAVGVIEKELGQWFTQEFNLEIWKQIGPNILVDPTSDVLESKGVGELRYVASEVALR